MVITEQHYIACTDLTKIRIMRSILRDVCAFGDENGISDKEYLAVFNQLKTWEQRLADKVLGKT